MKQEEKELLLKDLSARLFYGVKFESENAERVYFIDTSDDEIYINGTNIEDVKPYLFPLSSMTEEQWTDTPYANLNEFTFLSFKCGGSTLAFETYEVNLSYVVDFINWCYKNHFDVYGLIEKGLAIDATNLNIY